MSRKGNCLDNAATEQVFGHLEGEFFLDQTWIAMKILKVNYQIKCKVTE